METEAAMVNMRDKRFQVNHEVIVERILTFRK